MLHIIMELYKLYKRHWIVSSVFYYLYNHLYNLQKLRSQIIKCNCNKKDEDHKHLSLISPSVTC